MAGRRAGTAEPPNNWLSVFGGRAWQWDENTRQYYCHSFLKEQPDLNWRNPEVQEAMLDVMRFWLGKGVDGFRVDALWHVMKDEQFRDNPANPEYVEGEMSPYHRLIPVYSGGQAELHEVVASDAAGDAGVPASACCSGRCTCRWRSWCSITGRRATAGFTCRIISS